MKSNDSSRRFASPAAVLAQLCLLTVVGAAALPAVAVEAQDASAAGPAVDVPFDVWEIRVLGNSVLPAIEIERVVYPHLGKDRHMAELEQVREALAALYRERGYGTVLVDIPEQSVTDGVVRLKVTEGRLGSLRVTGARYYSNRAIRAALPGIEPGVTPRLPELQNALAGLARQSPDRKITPVLKSGATPGTFDLDLRVQDRAPLHGALEVNDRYSADTERLRLTATLSYDNLFQAGHSLSLQYQTSPQEPSQVKVAALTYVARSAGSPNAWVFYGLKSDSDVAALGTLAVLGRGYVLGTRYVLPVASRPDRQASFSFGVDYKDFKEDIRLAGADPARTPVGYLAFSGGYSDSATFGSLTAAGNLGLTFGQRGLGNTSAEFAAKRFEGRPNFVALRGGASLARSLGALGFVRGRATFQYSPQALVSNEQASFGGIDTVRGFLESESLADLGASGSVELGRVLLADPQRPMSGLTALLFVDAAVGSVQDPLPGQVTRVDLASYGAGLRLNRPSWLDTRLDWARTLTAGPRTADGESRWHFTVKIGF